MESAVEYSPQASDDADSLLVIDPLSVKLRIPKSAISETRAHHRHGVPSLCLLHVAKKCRQGNMCHQVHANPEVIEELRTQALNQTTCCGAHSDVNFHKVPKQWLSNSLAVHGTPIPMDRVAYTAGLQQLMHNSTTDTFNIPANVVCRLHGVTRCRFADDCKFIHVCREIVQRDLSHLLPSQEMTMNDPSSASHQLSPLAMPWTPSPPSWNDSNGTGGMYFGAPSRGLYTGPTSSSQQPSMPQAFTPYPTSLASGQIVQLTAPPVMGMSGQGPMGHVSHPNMFSMQPQMMQHNPMMGQPQMMQHNPMTGQMIQVFPGSAMVPQPMLINQVPMAAGGAPGGTYLVPVMQSQPGQMIQTAPMATPQGQYMQVSQGTQLGAGQSQQMIQFVLGDSGQPPQPQS